MPDERVQDAIDHWAPRFTTMGVDYNDFVRATRGLERWADWLDAWTVVADEHVELAEEAQDAGRMRTAGEAYLRATLCLHFGKFVWVLDGDRHRAATERAVATLRQAHAYLDPAAERIEAALGDGRLAANLRRPPGGIGAPRPGAAAAPLVVIIPGLDSTKEEFFHLENVFLARGMATLSMDGPGQGESASRLPIRPDYEVAVAAMLDALGGRDGIDTERVGACGVSLGGYYAPRAAAFEPRIRAVAGVSGPYNWGALWDRLPPLSRETFVFKSGARDDEDARARALELDLEGVMSRVTQPALFATGKLDRIIPWQQTERMAREATRAEFVLYEQGTHVCSNVPHRYRPLVADWMWEQLTAGRPPVSRAPATPRSRPPESPLASRD
jgi:pimeloyl-ACP methyl ester carboxylesterase